MAVGFQIVDYVVFIATLAVSLGIGVFFSFRQKSTEEYFHGRRQLQLVPVAISMMATFTSAVSMLGTPAEIYSYGAQYTMHIFGAVLGNVMGAMLFVPLFHPLEITSVFEYIQFRFKSVKLKLFANIIKLIAQVFLNGVGIYAPSVALETVTGLPVWISMLLCGITTTVYTSIGGMKAVIWTDVFQSFFIYSGMVTICVVGWLKVGSFSRVFELNQVWDRLSFFNMSPDPTLRSTFWSNVVCQGILYFSLTAVQPSVQRYCGLPTLKKAKQCLYINAIGLFLSGLLFSVAGLVVFAYYAGISCDPIKAGLIRNPNQILPYFVMEVVNFPGLPGIFVACLASTALSTSSSTLNGCAAMIWQDLLSEKLKHISEKSKATISKAIVFGIGGISIASAFFIMNIKGTLIQVVMGIGGALLGPNTGLYCLGAVNPRPNAKAATIGFASALTFTCFLGIGASLTEVHLGTMPSPTDGCHLLANGSLFNGPFNYTSAYNFEDGADIFNRTLRSVALPTSPEGILLTTALPHSCPTMGDYILGYFKKLFSISYLYYTLFGITIVVTVGSLLGLHPYFAADYYVEDKHLFSFVAYIRRKMDEREACKSSGKKHKKCDEVELKENPETPPPTYNCDLVINDLEERNKLLSSADADSIEKSPIDTV